jgi:hypothetical protein
VLRRGDLNEEGGAVAAKALPQERDAVCQTPYGFQRMRWSQRGRGAQQHPEVASSHHDASPDGGFGLASRLAAGGDEALRLCGGEAAINPC